MLCFICGYPTAPGELDFEALPILNSNTPEVELSSHYILEAAEAGCTACAFFVEFVQNTEPDVSFDDTGHWTFRIEEDDEEPKHIILTDGTRKIIFEHFYLLQRNMLNQPSDEARVDARYLPSGDTSSSPCFERILSWLDTCRLQHPNCNLNDHVQLPTRLVSVSPSTPGSVPRIQLVETKGLFGTYACLSYCWGSSRPDCITTSQTLARNLKSIPWTSLPILFRDIMGLLLKLGIQYLWIDAICIIQDNQDDWRTEAAQMAEIYSNAILTIAAANSNDSARGLFSKIPTKFQAAPVSGLDNIYMRQTWIHPGAETNEDQSDLLSQVPLLTRGWVLQERQLSARVLYFLSSEVAWECNTAVQCECTPSELSFQRQNSYSVWNQVVDRYCDLSLSFQKDRLPAIAGIARRFQGNGKYLAGLWEGSLYEDLCWGVFKATTATKPRPSSWRAPTWSWASVQDELFGHPRPRCNHDRRGPFAFRVQESYVKHLGTDTLGELEAAHLLISAHLLKGRLVYDSSLNTGSNKLRDDITVEIGADRTLLLHPDYLLSWPGDDFIAPGADVFLMYCGHVEADGVDPGDEESNASVTELLTGHYYIVITRSGTESQLPVFKRIGIADSGYVVGSMDVIDSQPPLQATGWTEVEFKLI